jgi:hypothetical protein
VFITRGIFISIPFQYTDKDETSEDVSKYKKYFTKKTDENPGFKVGYMYKLERNNAKRHNLGRAIKKDKRTNNAS